MNQNNVNDGSLAHDLQMYDDYETRSYPPEGDTTSEGPSSAPAPNPFSRGSHNQRYANKAQQTDPSPSPSPAPGPSLIAQSPDGGPLSAAELEDAQWGGDTRAREDFAHAARRDFDARSPFGRHPGSGTEREREREREREGKEGREVEASAYADARGRQFESGPAGGAGEDVGAF
ncbi:hypothetical protein GSI_09549 [Ganoderma sinense ZZ0214-1]|uniref:Uncharacterized protein n=1 Tax=Ganoderma sinense ZZ0214-1 TaxID=1077348 RepID=A0A2G8S4B1_9APHY|nr:hypothetical protein GSI_09549 [Ganoderma sinense ZZ0214-1]